ncbi:antibiotic biosynthesis monooxygenase family protein [Streptomyces formicae]|uniref:Monooxygenase n=2 Tax=Streptomyces TaxID=1883 RepID=A0A291QIZ0_9ACTN|nr:antibiotic biosynthesis monooxygenase family protein [Streptomyces formicae]AQP25567.1 monooxygenase/cyclase [Streptomyces sp. KY5]ATL31689.1 Monooxygenase [Streptomyces formicae]
MSQEEPHLRVLFLVRVESGGADRFVTAYEHIRHQVARAEGHVGDELCQSLTDPDEWLITSEWVSAAHYRAWAESPGQPDLAAPITAASVTYVHKPFAVRLRTAAPL